MECAVDRIFAIRTEKYIQQEDAKACVHQSREDEVGDMEIPV